MDTEILTPKEFAEHLKIGRTTVFDWVRKGYLINGRHYFRVDRTIRFPWSSRLVDELLLDLKELDVAGADLDDMPEDQ